MCDNNVNICLCSAVDDAEKDVENSQSELEKDDSAPTDKVETKEAEAEKQTETLETGLPKTEGEMATPMRQVAAKIANGTGNKRVSFGPDLSPEQFDIALPPATPVKRGATPRRSARIFSGLKNGKPDIESVPEEVNA